MSLGGKGKGAGRQESKLLSRNAALAWVKRNVASAAFAVSFDRAEIFTDPNAGNVYVAMTFDTPQATIPYSLVKATHAVANQQAPGALALISRAAEGSMRDALSLLDQLIAFGGGNLTEDHARAMLGTIDRGHVTRLADALARGDGPALLA